MSDTKVCNTWIEVKPSGYLKKFGNHKFFVKDSAEALKAMFMQVKGFEEAFKSADKKGLGFALVTNDRNVNDLAELRMGKPKVLKIVPKYFGRKSNSGLGMIFAAAAIALVIAFPPAGLAASGWLAAGSTSLAIATSVAISLALGGITQLLAPQPPGIKTRQAPENEASYAFGGPVNTTAQGQPVPLFYGEREVGGAIVSAEIVAEDQK